MVAVTNDANEIGTISATTGTDWVDPTYDAAGNMTKRPDPAAPGSSASAQTLVYDAWNRLVKITDNAGSPATIAEYEYDGLGRRIEKTSGGDTWDYYHSSSWQVLEVRKNGSTNPQEQFVYDPTYIDAVVMRYRDADTDGNLTDAGDGEQYYTRDASFNIVALLDDAGDVLERYRYTPYGQRVVMNASFVEIAATAYANFRGFQGLLHDYESGLIENRNRMFDPLTGRFLQRDLAGYPDGMSAYAAYHLMFQLFDPYGESVLGSVLNRATKPLHGAVQGIKNSLANRFESLLVPIIGEIKDYFTQWKDKAGVSYRFQEDVRWRKDWGAYPFNGNMTFGIGIQVKADCQCVMVAGVGFGQVEQKLPFIFKSQFVGRGNVRFEGSWEYCVDGIHGEGKWDGGVRFSFSGGVQYDVGAILRYVGGAKITAEVGVGTSNYYSFATGSWSGWGFAVYGRIYAEWKLGGFADRHRREFRVVFGDQSVGID